jgi:NTE family protein
MTIQELRDSNFSLVLSGGGALGIAHLGVIEELEEKNLKPSEIVGTSMGGIIGACLAIGMKQEEIYSQIKQFAGIGNWIKLSLSGNSIIKSDKIASIFESIFGDLKIRDCKIELKIIATNLLTGQKRVFDKSSDTLLKDALLCTMAIPGVFEEQSIDGEILGDGFLCENLGVREATYQKILAVDVMGYDSFEHNLPNNFFKTANVMEMFERSMRLLIFNQTQTALETLKEREIYLISPKTRDFKTFHFNRAEEIRELGRGFIKI